MTMDNKGKKTAVKKRVVPFLSYNVNDFSEYGILASMPETHGIVFDNLLEAIKFSIAKKKESADIFKLNENYCVSLEKDKWSIALKKAIQHYSSEGVENYEKCKQCQDIIEKLSL